MAKKESAEKAVEYYENGLREPASEPLSRYLLNNNLAFSLNELGHHERAEACCRAAIEVSADQHNAHKNLGVALEGQGRCVNAAESYLCAARLSEYDARPLMHLENLLEAQPDLIKSLPDLPDQVDALRRDLRASRQHDH